MTFVHRSRDLFHRLSDDDGVAAYTDVLRPWLAEHGPAVAEVLAPLRTHGGWWRERYGVGDPVEQAYALSRVNDVLLLGFQEFTPEGTGSYAHYVVEGVADWPTVGLDEYVAFFTALGLSVVDGRGFDPFFHEIVEVEQDPDPDRPIEIVGAVWPGLMWGEMLFSRAGVRVRAGLRHAVAGVADRSALREVYLRRYRPTYDLSLDSGTNSQWATDFRRDYLTADAYHLNVDGRDEERAYLAGDPRHELLRHRCALIAEIDDVSLMDLRVAVPRDQPRR